MLRIIKNTKLQDYLRTCQASRGYGLQIYSDLVPAQIYGLYSPDSGIVSIKLKQIDNGYTILAEISLSTDLLLYVSNQYYFDKTKLYNVTIPEGVYFYEITTNTDIFYSEIFKIQTINDRFLASSPLLASSDKPVSDVYSIQ